jgi:hypothetical protein
MKAGRLALPVALLVAPWGCAQVLDFDAPFEGGSKTTSATGAGGTKSTSATGAGGTKSTSTSSVASTSSATSGGGAGGMSGTGGDAGEDGGIDAGPPLVCDPRFKISANPVVAGVAFTATFTDTPGYVYIALSLNGPGVPVATDQVISGSGPYSWKWTVSGHAAGTLTLTFLKDVHPPSAPGTIVGTCQVAVEPG